MLLGFHQACCAAVNIEPATLPRLLAERLRIIRRRGGFGFCGWNPGVCPWAVFPVTVSGIMMTGDRSMTITLPLQPGEEAKLVALAQAKGLSTDALVREALDKILADAPDQPQEPKLESRPIWDVILDNMKDVRAEEFAKLPKDGASEHDHYLYGHPKRAQ